VLVQSTLEYKKNVLIHDESSFTQGEFIKMHSHCNHYSRVAIIYPALWLADISNEVQNQMLSTLYNQMHLIRVNNR